jgi:hypothetical protein
LCRDARWQPVLLLASRDSAFLQAAFDGSGLLFLERQEK